jgi:predicted metalloprotease
MRWIGGRESSNVDDRRGVSAGGIAAGGGIIGVIVIVLRLLLGGGGTDDGSMPQIQLPGQTQQLTPEQQAAEDERAKFVKVVLGYTEDVWDNPVCSARKPLSTTHTCSFPWRRSVSMW